MARIALPVLLATAAFGAAVTTSAQGTPGTVDPTVPAARDTDAVVLTGKDLLAGSKAWSVPENLTVAVPGKDAQCIASAMNGCGDGQENHYVGADADTAGTQSQLPVQGTPTEKILGYKWDGAKFVQIPFQVDEVFTRYLNNDASGFGFYSGTDKHTDYAYDREPFRFSANDPNDPCKAAPKDGIATTPDPVAGLDSNDELAFMFRDAGDQAPAGATLPAHLAGVKVVTITDPTNPSAAPKYVYVAAADDSADAPKPAFNAGNGYVRYVRDPGYDRLVHERSNNGDYGPGVKGPYCTMDGHLVTNPDGTPKIDSRKEIDTATIYTPRYAWRYDGRWLMTGMQIAQTPQDPWSEDRAYGPDLLDRWKARAFAQDPASKTPCCGYEEEDTNWGGSSILLGEKVGPVRVIRATWGADSGTNVIRRETFYRDRVVQKSWLRVHVIPPSDGIYAQWDFNAGRMTKFFNDYNMGGIAVDGVNDEAYGNWDDPCNPRWDGNGRTQVDATYRSAYQQAGLCADNNPIKGQEHASQDPGDVTFADANSALGWAEVGGPWGTIVDRIHAEVTDITPGGLAQSIVATPYYRDDSCFDDGTGSDPGPELFPKEDKGRKEYQSKASDGSARRCWQASDGPTSHANEHANDHAFGDARGDDHFWQGDIGTHGLHLLFQAESDNARTTVPIDEIVSDWDFVMLPPSQSLDATGQPKNLGEQYGRPLEKPLVAVVTDHVQ